jgi:hypothetical protein
MGRGGTDRRQRQAAFLFAKSERRLGFPRRSSVTRLSSAIASPVRWLGPARQEGPFKPTRNSNRGAKESGEEASYRTPPT